MMTNEEKTAGAEAPVLRVRNLRVVIPTRRGDVVALDQVDLEIGRGEIVGMVGESGAGKSMTGQAVIGLLPHSARVDAGEIWLSGERIDRLPEAERQKLRGRRIGAIFQDPLTSLDPLRTVGDQIVETILTHHKNLSHGDARRRAVELLRETGIPSPRERVSQYPHHFSGGMRQRVVIALALAADPELIIADEPTTALDVSIQAQIITLLKKLARERGASVLLITHDMGVIAETADRVAVLYAGRIVEVGRVADVIGRPQHPYTKGLMGAIPDIRAGGFWLEQIEGVMPGPSERPAGCPFHPRCRAAMEKCALETPPLMDMETSRAACWLAAPEGRAVPHSLLRFHPREKRNWTEVARERSDMLAKVPVVLETEGLSKIFDVSASRFTRLFTREERKFVRAVSEVSIAVRRGETLALVGESGCGKSTFARLVAGLYEGTAGRLMLDGDAVSPDSTGAEREAFSRHLSRKLNMIFQDPYASLNPRMKIRRIVAEPLETLHPEMGAQEVSERVAKAIELVRMPPETLEKYPHQFSGGQRQRISIARALAARPEFLICDEPTSALDVSVQAQVLNLMKELQLEFGITYLFISHNLAVVHHMSDRVGVMYLGRLVELAEKKDLFDEPLHPYTKLLLAAIPSLGAGVARTPVKGEVPSPLNPPPGCPFHPRCPHAAAECRRSIPALRKVAFERDGARRTRWVACHRPT